MPRQSAGRLLDRVFGHARVPGGGRRWITLAPWRYVCAMCDTGGEALMVASIRVCSGQRSIVCHNTEWRHDFHDAGLSDEDHTRAVAAIRHHLANPGIAASWDAGRQKLQLVRAQVVHARTIDWRSPPSTLF